MRKMRTTLVALFLCCCPAIAQTKNVIFVMADGVRWQEVFQGADAWLLESNASKKAFWRDSENDRRMALMPFLWGNVVKNGQIYGNRLMGSEAQDRKSTRLNSSH